MPTESIAHNFVITDIETSEKFVEVFDQPKIQKSDVSAEVVSGINDVRLLTIKCKESIKQGRCK